MRNPCLFTCVRPTTISVHLSIVGFTSYLVAVAACSILLANTKIPPTGGRTVDRKDSNFGLLKVQFLYLDMM